MLLRVALFLVVLLGLEALIYGYLGTRLAGWPPAGLGWLGWGLALTHALSIPAAFVLQRDTGGRLGDGVAWFAFLGMGALSLLVVSTALVDLGAFVVEAAGGGAAFASVVGEQPPSGRLPRGLQLGILGLTAAMLLMGLLGVSRGARVVEVDIPIAGLHPSLQGLRIVQLSDIHVGPTVKAQQVRRLVDQANALEPDLIALTGDLVDGSVRILRPHTAPLADLRAPLGTFFVTGNHEYYSGALEWLEEVQRLGLRTLVNQHEELAVGEATLAVCGVTDMHGGRIVAEHEPDYLAALSGTEEADLRLLLAHQPLQVRGTTGLGVDLQLSGHTHGGQYFPFTVIIRVAQPYNTGLHRVEGTWLYVNAGSAYWGPPLRLGQPAEITLLRLVAAPQAEGASA